MAYRAAFATSDGLTVYKHFGQANEYLVADILEDHYEIVARRNVVPPCNARGHSEAAFDAVLDALSDCEAIFVGKVGVGAAEYIASRGINVFETPGVIDEIFLKQKSQAPLDKKRDI
ncbi:MAG: dinitrogenase iron-molybdenum cofactor biosynthesis protein [Clostridiales Family XIII bacterium]|nr:dinitrogenase iron-molybdenum cofactor biosynthesis protein [Clostridiales Family XIII bacterium]